MNQKNVSTTMQHKKSPTAYLTKRKLITLSKSAFRIAANDTMRIMGYNVVVEKGWVVKKFKDGKVEKLEQIEQAKFPLCID